MQGLLFLLIGPAGVGKNTLIKAVTKESGLVCFLPTFSSRPMREGESEGRPYHFLTRAAFEKKIVEGSLIEWKCVHGENYYGVDRDFVDKALTKSDLITDIDILGALDVIDFMPSLVVSIFVNIKSKDKLIERMQKRGCSEEELVKRIARLDLELRYKEHFDYYIENNDLKTSVCELRSIIEFERSLSHYRFRQKDMLHYVVRLIITNSKGEFLLCTQKSPVTKDKWKFIETHVLKSETPKDALTRELRFIFPSLATKDKAEQKPSYSYIKENLYSLNSHKHYEMTFHVAMGNDNGSMYSDNYYFRWFSFDKASKYLSSSDIDIVSKKGLLLYS